MKFAATCPCRWSTPQSGLPVAAASAFAELRPISSAPTSPGPRVTAIESISASPTPGLGERGVDDRVDQLEVVPGGDLGHDAAEALVGRRLRGDHVRADRAAVEHGRAGVVAGRLDAEDHRQLAGRRLAGSGADRRRLEPHDQCVLAVVVVVAAAVPGGAEAEASYIPIAALLEVRTSSVNRASGPACVEQVLHQLAWRFPPPALGGDRNVHQVPDVCVAGADQVADEAVRAGDRARQIPDGLESSSTNIASDHGVVKERRSMARTAGRSP